MGSVETKEWYLLTTKQQWKQHRIHHTKLIRYPGGPTTIECRPWIRRWEWDSGIKVFHSTNSEELRRQIPLGKDRNINCINYAAGSTVRIWCFSPWQAFVGGRREAEDPSAFLVSIQNRGGALKQGKAVGRKGSEEIWEDVESMPRWAQGSTQICLLSLVFPPQFPLF